jgi:hypothetical protein
MVYDQDLVSGRSLLPVIGHYDLALDAQEREVIIFQDIEEDNISLVDLVTGTITPLWSIDFSHTAVGFHFSGGAFRRPGWALVSTYDSAPGSHTWMDDQVLAVELKPGGRVLRLAHTHSVVDDSLEHDWTGQVEAFLIVLPPDWPERLSTN